MKVLDRIEDLMENVIEGVFRRKIKNPLQPIEVGKKLIKAMEGQKRISIANTYVPNHYLISLHPDQVLEFQTLQNTLVQELKGVLYQKAEKEYLSFIGQLKIDFQEDPSLSSGIIVVEAFFTEDSKATTEEFLLGSEQAANGHTQIFKKPELIQKSIPRLVIKTGEQHQIFELSERKNYSIGRSNKCDFILDDHNVSRIHGWFKFVNDHWYLKDDRSTNGTFVNEQKVRSHQLISGDEVRIGTTTLIYQDEA